MRCYLWRGHEGRHDYRAESGRPAWDVGNCLAVEGRCDGAGLALPNLRQVGAWLERAADAVAASMPAELPEPEPLRDIDEPLAIEAESLLERAAARLAVAGDDAGELAAGLGLDCLAAVLEGAEDRAARAARLTLRLCRTAEELRDLAEAVGRHE